jgi:septal ring factor EnvC (AmiA/AmiB activator)
MKSKVAIIILVLVCVALAVALVTGQRSHADFKKKTEEELADRSARLQDTSKKLEEQMVVNMTLEKNIKARGEELTAVSNNLTKVMADLEKSDAQAKATAEQLRTAQAELAKKDQRITELENERIVLGRQMDQLTNSITDLGKQIAVTEKKLAATQGEKEFLVKELTRLRAEKAELERQFNDLAVLRAQISKIKEELAIARRLEFIRLGLFGVTAKGGAEKLMTKPAPPRVDATNYDLNVEVRQGGGARVVAPTNSAATPATNTPARLPQDAPPGPPK